MSDQGITTHLGAFRVCLINIFLGLAIGVGASFFFVPKLLSFLVRPYLTYLAQQGFQQGALHSLSPPDTFQITVEVAIFLGIGVTLPWILYQVWKFVAPGLYHEERKCAVFLALPALFFFAAGVVFSYFVVLPPLLAFFHNYTLSLHISPDWAVLPYFRFVISTIFIFGLAFELPVVILALSWFGVVTPAFLAAHRKHSIVVIFVVAAIVTPPDVVSQLMLGVPLVLLYEISILAARIAVRRAKNSAQLLS